MQSAAIIVQKYGGSSLASPEAVQKIARRVADLHHRQTRVVVVVSAVGTATDELLQKAQELSKTPVPRELDMLLVTGEQGSAALMALAIQAAGAPAVALTGSQCGIVTNSVHNNAQILEIDPSRIFQELRRGAVVVAAGFQGISREGELTTLGRGGSDTSAVAIAAALGADRCEIFSDVDGIFSADPRFVSDAQPLAELSFSEMQELAWQGARILKAEAVEFARDHGISLGVGNSVAGKAVSWVSSEESRVDKAWRSRRRPISGVAGRKDLLRVRSKTVISRKDLEDLLEILGRYDLIFGRLPSTKALWSLYLSLDEIPDTDAFREEVRAVVAHRVEVSGPMGAVSLVGFGLGARPQSLVDMASFLEGCNIETWDGWTSREALTFVVPQENVDRALRALHRGFVSTQEKDATSSLSA